MSLKQLKDEAKDKNYPYSKFAGGFITWSVLPLSENTVNHYGQLTSYTAASISSGKRRMWFILIDHCIQVYNAKSIKPKFSFPMSAVSVHAVDGEVGMFAMRTPTESLFLNCRRRKRRSNMVQLIRRVSRIKRNLIKH